VVFTGSAVRRFLGSRQKEKWRLLTAPDVPWRLLTVGVPRLGFSQQNRCYRCSSDTRAHSGHARGRAEPERNSPLPQPSTFFNSRPHHVPSRSIMFDHLPGTRQGFLAPLKTVPQHSFRLTHDDADLMRNCASSSDLWPARMAELCHPTPCLGPVLARFRSALQMDARPRSSGLRLWALDLEPQASARKSGLPPGFTVATRDVGKEMVKFPPLARISWLFKRRGLK
jgi:hypothetical protein